jgi:methionyl aminopeptidase
LASERHVSPGAEEAGVSSTERGRSPTGWFTKRTAEAWLREQPGPSVRPAAASRVALNRALASARAGVPINVIGRAVHTSMKSAGSAVCSDLMGHGIGRRIHEPPNIPNYDAHGLGQPLTEGLVITIEPIIAAGHGAVQDAGDGWTISTQVGSYAAHAGPAPRT